LAKPRALSSQADAHIKIEVHRDIKIRNYLQAEKQDNMNLMFYDFNGSSTGHTALKTAQNFYKPNVENRKLIDKAECDLIEAPVNYGGNGDRVPTRERCYRSAN